LTAGAVDVIDLSLGETVSGIMLGAFSVYFLHWLSETNYPKIGVVTGIATALFTLLTLLFLGTQKADLGGADAFIASFIGITVALTITPSFRLAEALVTFVTAAGITALPMTFQPEIENGTSVVKTEPTAKKQEEPSLFEGETISVDSIIGDYRINEQTVQLKFHLGPQGGITKGSFKSFSGTVSIKKDISRSAFAIELPFAQLTTFNRYRDESLAEESYFNAAKYPVMSYASKKLTKKDGLYELEGVFTMLGVSNPLNIELKYVGRTGSNQAPVLVGRSSIDRTEFGMKPDSKEGNVVDLEFRVELIK
jgi:polyisoprenoid-binding protein YceI